jgi:Domain of Unknown Function (DUF928)
MPFSQRIKAVPVVLLLSAIAVIDLPQSTLATPTHRTQITQIARRLNFLVGVRPALFRVGGFSRSASCSSQTATALVPPPQTQEQVPTDKAPIDKTTLEYPTFWVYVPQLPGATATFTLMTEAESNKDETQRIPLYTTSKFKLTDKPGIVGISLPRSVPLQIGQKYVWSMTIYCDSDPQPKSFTRIGGWIERLKPLVSKTGDKLSALAEGGIWQDVVTALALKRYQQPNDRAAAKDWADVMKDAGLPQFQQTAIVQIVKN